MGIFSIKYICKSFLPSHSGSNKKSPPAGMCKHGSLRVLLFPSDPNLGSPVTSYLVPGCVSTARGCRKAAGSRFSFV